jgi:hypothetical protein
MAKRRAGRCVHCLQQVEALTNDHLFPRSWYPKTTPPDLEKWKFPACSPCNTSYGKIEEGLRLRLAACLDPKASSSAGIWQSVLDSMNPEQARDPYDAFKRKVARQRFLREVKSADMDKYRDHLLPEIHPERPMGTLALHVPAKHIEKLVEKLVRGVVYLTKSSSRNWCVEWFT